MKFPTISLPTLKSLKLSDIIIGTSLLCLAGLIILAYLVPITPPIEVTPAATVVPLPRETLQERPQEPQEESQESQEPQMSPESPQDDLSAPNSPTPAPAILVLPLPPPSAIEDPVEVKVVPAAPHRCRPRYRRCH